MRARALTGRPRCAARRRSDAFLEHRRPAALGAKDVQRKTDRVPAARVRAGFGLDRLEVLDPCAVEAADNTGVADRDVEAVTFGVVHDDVGDAGQVETFCYLSRVAVDNDQLTSIGGAEQAPVVKPQPFGAIARDVD